MTQGVKCSACAKDLDPQMEGIEVFGSWFCSMCFISHSRGFNRELRPDEVEALRRLGRELSGLLPPELVEMILVGFLRRCTTPDARPPADELGRCVGEIQRVTAFAVFRQTLSLLKTMRDLFVDFSQEQETEIRDKIRRLTGGE